MSTVNKNTNTATLVKWAITIIVPILLLLTPLTETYTSVMRTYMILTVFGIMLFLFELLPGPIIGLVIFTSYPLFKVCTLKVALSTWSNSVVVICLVILILIEIVQNTPILKRISYWIISKTGGSYFGLLVGIILADIVMDFVIPSGSNAYIMMALALGIIKALDLDYYDPMAVAILFTTLFGLREANDWIYGVQAIGMSAAYCQTAVPELTVGYVDIIKDNIVFLPLLFVMAWMYTKLFKPNKPFKGGKEYFQNELKALGPMGSDEKKVTAVLLVMLVYLFSTQWTKMDMTFGFILAPIALFLPGINVAKAKNVANVNISPVILLATTISIGTVGSSIGIGDWVSSIATPFLSGNSPFLFTGMVWIIGVVCNVFLTPAALQAMFCAPLATIAVDLGYSAKVIAYTIYHCGNQVFFPYETNTILVFYSLGYTTMKQFMKCSLSKMALDFLFLMCLAVPYWMLLGLY